MQEKLLSISIAAYNVEQYLVKTLQSLILDAEHMKVLEVIIVNDGSKDNTSQIGQEYVLKYPDTFKLINQENGGYGSTINTSLAVARGKYYKLLDGDDWYDSENFENCNTLNSTFLISEEIFDEAMVQNKVEIACKNHSITEEQYKKFVKEILTDWEYTNEQDISLKHLLFTLPYKVQVFKNKKKNEKSIIDRRNISPRKDNREHGENPLNRAKVHQTKTADDIHGR